MNKHTFYSILIIFIAFSCTQTNPGNRKEKFDFGWKFMAEEVEGAEASDFDDASWRTVDLPHDWSIEGGFSQDHPSFSRGGWLPTGNVTYRKRFTIPSKDTGKRVVIYFDGAYRNAEVYINGKLLGKRPLGYIAFHYDMTSYINFGGENTLTVKLDNSEQPGSRWYTGTGIYRHVHLITTEKLYVPVWGNYIKVDTMKDGQASILVETKVQNEFDLEKDVTVQQTVFSPDGKKVASGQQSVKLPAGKSESVQIKVTVNDPQLWKMDDPNLYQVTTDLLVGGRRVYGETNKTGIRTLEFNNEDGFKLNGEEVKIKGVCLHHDGGPLGAAIHRRTIERQLEKLREMGANAVRTAHNPFSEEFMDVCDSMGFLVMNEMFDEWEVVKEPATTQNGKKIRIPVTFYAHLFEKWSDKDLTDFVLRDRNHPSVIMWSIGNEIDQMHEPEGEAIGKRLAAIIHELDDRPVTNGVNGYGWGNWPDSAAAATSDIYGYNYIKGDGLDKEREENPGVKTIITEHASAQSFYPRATYLYGSAKKAWWDKLGYEHQDAYEWVERRDLRGERGINAWKWVKARKHVMGMFIWTGWDYLGEVIPFGWPARSSSFAPIDLAGFPKDGYYFYQSQWTDEPMVHIFPHWNLKGAEGDTVTVYAFTNGDEVELFQDGKSKGKRTNDPDSVQYQSWEVVYQPGELKAIAYKQGEKVAEKMIRTAGPPAAIKVETRRFGMKANRQDLIYVECTILDEAGNEVPTADNLLSFEVEGPATIAGVANGDNMGLEPFKSNKRKAFNGKCLVVLQSTQTPGEITCSVRAEGLEGVEINLRSN